MKYLLTIWMGLSATLVAAQPDHERAVLNRIAALNCAIFIDKDSVALERLLAGTVTYGHSNGAVENRPEMIQRAVHNTATYSDFVMESATVAFEGNTAIARHVLKAATMDQGKKSILHLNVLQVWIKEKKEWKLRARQAVKPAT